MKVNKRFYEFSAGRAGSGKINLATGDLTFIHQTTDPDSSTLPVSISHVYQSGKGWKLNLSQRIDKDGESYIHTDGAGQEHKFTEKFFQRSNDGQKIYLQKTRQEIYISQDGRLWLDKKNTKEVFSEMISSDGLILQVSPDGFLGSKKIETRHEELAQVKDHLKSIRRQICDLEGTIKENSNFAKPETITISEGTNRTLKFSSLRTLQLFIEAESQRMERQAIADFNSLSGPKSEMLKKQGRLRHETKKGMGEVWRINPINMTDDNAQNFTFAAMTRAQRWTHINNHSARMADSLQTRIQYTSGNVSGADAGIARRTRGMLVYQQRFQETCERIQQDIQDLSAMIEGRNWVAQIRANGDRSVMLNLQTRFRELQNEFEDARRALFLARWNEDLIEARAHLAQYQHIEKILLTQLPVNYVIADKILGFNEAGNLVAIFDNYDNQVAIIYDGDRIIRITGSDEREITLEYKKGRLEWINDFQDRKTYFKYNYKGQLKNIVYPNGHSSEFIYSAAEGRPITFLPPSKVGISLSYNHGNISSVSAFTKRLCKYDFEKIALFSFRENTVVTCAKTGDKITYTFVDGNLQHELLWGEFDKKLVTIYRSDDRETFAEQTVDNQSDICHLKEEHLMIGKGMSPPVLFGSEDWIVNMSTLDIEGNPISRNIWTNHQSRTTAYDYKRFTDSRRSLLIKTQETTTNLSTGETTTSSIQYFYNKQGELIRTTESDGTVSEFGLNMAVYHKSAPDERFISGQSKTTYDYINGTNKVSSITDPRGGKTTLGRDFATSRVTSMSSIASGERNGTNFQYTEDFLVGLSNSNTQFEYKYDHWGRKSEIKLNGKTYVTYSYSTVKDRDIHDGQGVRDKVDMILAMYASGEIYKTLSDKWGRLLAVNYVKATKAITDIQPGEVVILKNLYDHPRGWLTKSLDYRTAESTEFIEYDARGNVIAQKTKGLFAGNPEVPAQLLEIKQSFDLGDRLQTLSYTVDTRKPDLDYEFIYSDDKLVKISTPVGDLDLETDNLARLTSTINKAVTDQYGYFQHADSATNQINLHTQNGQRTRYEYDPNGNIIRTRNGFNKVVQEYEYDELNRLVKDNDTQIGYDNNGNILFKGDIEYVYNSMGQLVRFGDEDGFAYDKLGNPKTYRGHRLSWNNLRNLESHDDIEFKYNVSGLRTYKSHQVGDTLHESYYHWANDQLISETRVATRNTCNPETEEIHIHDTTTTLDYIYGVDGIIGFVKNNKDKFYFLKNIQGDVTKILNETGETVAEYTYDAWGHIIHSSGELADLNPIRYRGYYYDNETNLYYLKTRYYDPEVARFINMDDISILEISMDMINGLNLYAYCFNDPVNHFDDDGRIFRRIGNWASNLGRGIWNGFRGVANGVRDTVVGLFTDPLGTISNIWNSATTALNNFISDPLGTLWRSVQDNWNNFLNPLAPFRNPEEFGYRMGQGLGIVTVGVATMGVGKVVKAGCALFGRSVSTLRALPGSTRIYRAVSPAELASIRQTRRFSTLPGAYEGKQFGLALRETRNFANLQFNQGLYTRIVSVRVPNNVLAQFARTATDSFVFRSGVITVGRNQMALLNQTARRRRFFRL